MTITHQLSSATCEDSAGAPSAGPHGPSSSESQAINAQRSFLAKEEAREASHWRSRDVPERPRDGPTNPRSLSIGQRSGSDL